MTSFDELSQMIESFDFRFLANQAAGLRMFKRIIEDQGVFKELRDFASSEDGAEIVLKRIYELIFEEVDRNSENPHDSALAAYLLGLDFATSKYKNRAAHAISSTPQLWWAAKIAREILVQEHSESLATWNPSADTMPYTVSTNTFDFYQSA
jgi:hypothetical protein